RLRFVDDPDALAAVDPRTREIQLGMAFAERLWAYSYAYFELVRLGQAHGPGRPVDLPIKVRAALQAVQQADRRGGRLEWPEELPRPDPNEVAGAAGFSANELFLSVGAFA